MFSSTRVAAALRVCAQGFPAVAATAVTAALAPFGAAAASGLAALVGACALANAVRRRSALLPVPTAFIGS
jgi:hypothetical protein